MQRKGRDKEKQGKKKQKMKTWRTVMRWAATE